MLIYYHTMQYNTTNASKNVSFIKYYLTILLKSIHCMRASTDQKKIPHWVRVSYINHSQNGFLNGIDRQSHTQSSSKQSWNSLWQHIILIWTYKRVYLFFVFFCFALSSMYIFISNNIWKWFQWENSCKSNSMNLLWLYTHEV